MGFLLWGLLAGARIGQNPWKWAPFFLPPFRPLGVLRAQLSWSKPLLSPTGEGSHGVPVPHPPKPFPYPQSWHGCTLGHLVLCPVGDETYLGSKKCGSFSEFQLNVCHGGRGVGAGRGVDYASGLQMFSLSHGFFPLNYILHGTPIYLTGEKRVSWEKCRGRMARLPSHPPPCLHFHPLASDASLALCESHWIKPT